MRKLNPIFVISNQHIMFTHLMATIPLAQLAAPQANLLSGHDQIVAAVDMLFQGF